MLRKECFTKWVSPIHSRLKVIYFSEIVSTIRKCDFILQSVRNFAKSSTLNNENSSEPYIKTTTQELQKNKRKIKKAEHDGQGEIFHGIHPVHLALITRKRKVHCLYVKERLYVKPVKQILEIATALNVKKEVVSHYMLDKLCGSRPHQGVCLNVSPLPVQELNFDDSSSLWQNLKTDEKVPIWLLPYRVQDTMNMGGILRTAYFLGVDQVILPETHSAALSGTVSKASAGAMEVMDIKTLSNYTKLTEFIKAWKKHGGKVIGTAGDSESRDVVPITNYVADAPVLLIVGNEEKGVRDDILDMCDINVTIDTEVELHPLIDSLNVSVATGIVLHTLISNKKKSLPNR